MRRAAKIDRICQLCGTSFIQTNNRQRIKKYCSKECVFKAHSERTSGENNPRWNSENTYIYKCETCSKEFKSYSKNARFCSRQCLGRRKDNVERLKMLAPIAASTPRAPKEPVKRKTEKQSVCVKCGIIFLQPVDKHKRYCGSCSYYGKTHKGIKCVICGNLFDRKHPCNKRVTCSRECFSKLKAINQKGNKSHRWQGGKTSESMIIRGSLEYATWRLKVFERDNYTCVLCGQKGGKLNADHILPFAYFPELRLDIDNGRTLCYECHLKSDTFSHRSIKFKKEKNDKDTTQIQRRES